MGVKEDKEVDAGNRSWAMPTQSRIGEKREGPPSYLASSLLHCWAWASYSPPSPWPLPRRLQDRRAGRRRQRWVWFEGCDGTGRDTLVQRRIRSPDTGRIDSPRSNGQERPISPSRTMWGAPATATPVTAHPKSLTSHLLLVHSRPAHLELDLGGDVPVRVRLSFGARRSAPAAFSVLLRDSFSVSVGRDWMMKFAPPSPPAAGRYFIGLCCAVLSPVMGQRDLFGPALPVVETDWLCGLRPIDPARHLFFTSDPAQSGSGSVGISPWYTPDMLLDNWIWPRIRHVENAKLGPRAQSFPPLRSRDQNSTNMPVRTSISHLILFSAVMITVAVRFAWTDYVKSLRKRERCSSNSSTFLSTPSKKNI